MTRFIVVPQWQGSPSARAMQLVDGTEAIAGDLPRAACTTIDVPLEAGEALGTGIHRYSALARIRAMLDAELDQIREPVVTIGGDCSVSVGAIRAAAARHPGTAVVWFDAHPDLNTAETSPSGAFSGMALSAVLGAGPRDLALPADAVAAGRVVLAGVRDIDAGEKERADTFGLRVVDVSALADPDVLVDAVARTGADAVYVHVDLDVLDPAAITGVTSPMPFGADVPTLVAAIGRLRARFPLSGATIAGFAPPSPAAAVSDMGAILRIVGAVA